MVDVVTEIFCSSGQPCRNELARSTPEAATIRAGMTLRLEYIIATITQAASGTKTCKRTCRISFLRQPRRYWFEAAIDDEDGHRDGKCRSHEMSESADDGSDGDGGERYGAEDERLLGE